MTKLEKQQFFALYWGQKIGDYAGLNNAELNMNIICHVSSINVKPLLKISDEDAVECIKMRTDIHKNIEIEEKLIDGFRFSFEYESSKRRRKDAYFYNYISDYIMNIAQTDFLRSKGYALPWREYSIEKLVELNAIKLCS